MNTTVVNQTERIEKALSNWTKAENNAALREGWCLSACSAEKLKLQCQKIDDPEMASHEAGFEVPDLGSDEAAIKLLYQGLQPHHVLAKSIIQEYEPEEWVYILKVAA